MTYKLFQKETKMPSQTENQKKMMEKYQLLRKLVRNNGLQSLSEEDRVFFKQFWDLYSAE